MEFYIFYLENKTIIVIMKNIFWSAAFFVCFFSAKVTLGTLYLSVCVKTVYVLYIYSVKTSG